MSNCPKCKQSPRNGEPMICDNNCGTILCEFCKREYFVDEIGKTRLGHAEWCGENSDSDFVSDESESESYDSYISSDGDNRESYDSRESEDSNGGAYSSSRDSESYSYETGTDSDSGDYSGSDSYSSESEWPLF